MTDHWQERVLDFWFALDPAQWFKSDPELDHRIDEQFRDLWARHRELPVESFLAGPRSALAAVILFDQFPRNIFRGHADQFSTDHLALQIAKAAIDRGDDEALPASQRMFFYMPLEHSESLPDQERSVLLFTALGDARFLDFAKRHHDVIARFGRFPHRNAILGRTPRAAELAAGDVDPF